jgi:succinate dehydrogenase/fumarate reductase cytochrome b subunit
LKGERIVFVWIFHRVSGVVLLALLSLQLTSGFFQASSSDIAWVRALAGLHRHPALVCVLVFCVIFHALYGLRTIALDLGVRRHRLLFWVCTLLGWLVFAGFLAGYFTYVAT